MAKFMIKKNSNFIRILPEWAKVFARKYCSNTTSTYIFHGNIRDFLAQRTGDKEFSFVDIQDYIADVLFGYNGKIICFDRSSGISFVENPYDTIKNKTKNDYIYTLSKAFNVKNNEEQNINFFSRKITTALELIEKYFYEKIKEKERVIFILDYAETVVPSSTGSSYNEEDRFSFVTLKRWAYNPIFINKDITIILLTENLYELNQSLIKCPNVIKIHIPIPNEITRYNFLNYKLKEQELFLDNELSTSTVAKITGGLNLVNINQIIAESYHEKKSISLEFLRKRKKELIEAESVGLLEIIESQANLDYVSGHEFVKSTLKKAADNIKKGRLDVLPMGYLISGPIGTGKSFLVQCFTGEIGIPVVRMLNFRSKYVGVTESNLEKILDILKAMAPVAVIIDEADAVLGDRDMDGDSGTSNRVFAQLSSFMGNTEYRGRIIWFLITCRPDLLPVDIKRQGRCEEHLSLFYPSNEKEREELYRVMIKKLNITTEFKFKDDIFKKQKHVYSGADIESILIRAKSASATDGLEIVSEKDIIDAINNFIPPVYPYEVELQNLVSVLECTHVGMLPPQYSEIPRSKIVDTIINIKAMLNERN
jgi:ATP-dependent 26S proteasome regulatory subunit